MVFKRFILMQAQMRVSDMKDIYLYISFEVFDKTSVSGISGMIKGDDGTSRHRPHGFVLLLPFSSRFLSLSSLMPRNAKSDFMLPSFLRA